MSFRLTSNKTMCAARIKSGVGDRLMKAGFLIHEKLTEKVQAPPARTGVHYPRMRNVSAAEGEPPAKQEGDLQESIRVPERVTRHGKTTVKVGSRSKVGKWQETGTPKMPAHPWFRPTWKENQEAIIAEIVGQMGLFG